MPDVLDNPDEVERRFLYHAPNTETRELHDHVRAITLIYAQEMARLLPAGRERALTITALEESSFWAHAAIARQ